MQLAILMLAAVLHGSVTDVAGYELPGCSVRLASANRTYTAISDAGGRFELSYVAPETYELTVELPGLETVSRIIDVRGDESLAPIRMKVAPIVAPMTITCGSPCAATTRGTRWEPPLCPDYELHSSLIEAAGNGDRSAMAMLRRRYDLETSSFERYRIAGALLRRVDDGDLWADLAGAATLIVRHPRVNGDYPASFHEYCTRHSLGPNDVWSAGVAALEQAAADPRARPLLHEALQTSDAVLLRIAISGLARQRDHSALPAIRKALARATGSAPFLASQLTPFGTAEAEALRAEYTVR